MPAMLLTGKRFAFSRDALMHLGKILDEAILLARQQGYEVRYEHLGGEGTGYCQLGDKRWIVVDVAQPADEQLDRVAEAIIAAPHETIHCSDELRGHLRRATANLH